MALRIRRRSKTLPDERRQVEIQAGDVIHWRGMLIDDEVLEAILSSNKRLLWAFVKSDEGDVMAVPYSETNVIWMEETDILPESEVEI